MYDRNAEAERALVAEWRRKNPDQARAQSALNRARKINNGPADIISYFTVFQRDGGVCGICRERVDPDLKYPDPASGSLDHVIPLSKGGLHTYDNVTLAHLICNMRKGNRID